MKKIQLTQGKFTIVDDEDYIELNKYNWCVSKGRNTLYAVRRCSNKVIRIHRILLDCPENNMVDHINGNGLDNRKENLRICNKSQNNGNSKLRVDNTSGFKGVFYHKSTKKWTSQIKINGKRKYLGLFTDKLEAKEAYEKEAKKHLSEFYSEGIKYKDVKLNKKINNIKLIKKDRIKINNKKSLIIIYKS